MKGILEEKNQSEGTGQILKLCKSEKLQLKFFFN